MSHGVVVGIDGSVPSAAAAEWAAREARRSGLGLRIVHVAGTEADALDRDLGGGTVVPEPVAAIRDRVTAALPGLEVSPKPAPSSRRTACTPSDAPRPGHVTPAPFDLSRQVSDTTPPPAPGLPDTRRLRSTDDGEARIRHCPMPPGTATAPVRVARPPAAGLLARA
ncbi:universal stress protein [Streptomyces sp. BE20]|uniref:universal stress protein n=1 Tax=Streptomyces sp. BE20 TaxID=3002525 RepID=UPI002E774EAD|nr:universal stress protein [Streptomyces sp. BE20]MEE1825338.1 universal stress protein [Streptomyces sp. BE20]